MLGIGMGEMIVIGGIALVVIGPDKFPEFAKLVMRTVRDVRSYVDDAKHEIAKELIPVKKELDALSKYNPEDYIDKLVGDGDKNTEAELYGEEPFDYEHVKDDFTEPDEPTETDEPDKEVNLNREDEGLLNYESDSETPYGSEGVPNVEPHPEDYPRLEEEAETPQEDLGESTDEPPLAEGPQE